LRKAALDDIAETEYVGGWPIRRYIQDRTVIEDTESTIDLAAHGWGMHNYPERLAYSATPPDFGSLCIQRHRWANGGLLIIPNLWRCVRLRRRRGERTSIGELLLRLNYMASIFWSSLSVLFLMTFRFNGHLLTPLTFIAAAPYFLAMSMGLRYCGYKRLDVARISFAALNTLLCAYAIVAFVGLRNSLMDIWINVVSWLYKPQRYKPTPARRTAPASVSPGAQLEDWEQILYLGFVDRRRSPRSADTTSVALLEAMVTHDRGALATSPEIIDSRDIEAATEGRYRR
jgi:cellulose synthase/poly-beta-1,6-N-acetylglucosamine synthase-like glycosyltransferase